MSSLINQIDEHAGKKAYQSYTVTHGIETISILVPLSSVSVFESDFNAVVDKSKENLLEVVTRHSGKIRGG
jgi:hypothetical protein